MPSHVLLGNDGRWATMPVMNATVHICQPYDVTRTLCDRVSATEIAVDYSERKRTHAALCWGCVERAVAFDFVTRAYGDDDFASGHDLAVRIGALVLEKAPERR